MEPKAVPEMAAGQFLLSFAHSSFLSNLTSSRNFPRTSGSRLSAYPHCNEKESVTPSDDDMLAVLRKFFLTSPAGRATKMEG